MNGGSMKIYPVELISTTFLIYVKIDSEDRLLNLELVIKHLSKYFRTKIFLLEVDKEPKVPQKMVQEYNVKYEFVKNDDRVFHTTKYRNYMVAKCKTPYFFICDVDIIASPEAIIESVNHLKNSSFKCLVYPYNGCFYNISKKNRDKYFINNDYEFICECQKEHVLWFEYSVGGIFGGRTSDFDNYPIDNEKIYGWGPDDKERYYRLKRRGFKIVRIDAPLYHLHHKRNTNSKPIDKNVEIKNRLEYLKVLGANPD